MRERQRVPLATSRVERVVDQEGPIAFLEEACS